VFLLKLRTLLLRPNNSVKIQAVWRVEVRLEMVEDENQCFGQLRETDIRMSGVAGGMHAALRASFPDSRENC
jgi:hypothetical protein